MVYNCNNTLFHETHIRRFVHKENKHPSSFKLSNKFLRNTGSKLSLTRQVTFVLLRLILVAIFKSGKISASTDKVFISKNDKLLQASNPHNFRPLDWIIWIGSWPLTQELQNLLSWVSMLNRLHFLSDFGSYDVLSFLSRVRSRFWSNLRY